MRRRRLPGRLDPFPCCAVGRSVCLLRVPIRLFPCCHCDRSPCACEAIRALFGGTPLLRGDVLVWSDVVERCEDGQLPRAGRFEEELPRLEFRCVVLALCQGESDTVGARLFLWCAARSACAGSC